MVFEFYSCYYHVSHCKDFGDVQMLGQTLAQRYERIQSRLEAIVQAGYTVVTEWKYMWARVKIHGAEN
jgi:hypothetical protein